MSAQPIESTYKHVILTIPTATGGEENLTSRSFSVRDYRSFAVVVAGDGNGGVGIGTFDYQLEMKIPSGVENDGATVTTNALTATGEDWIAVESGSHDLADGPLVLRDTDSPYQELRLSVTPAAGGFSSGTVNAWVFYKRG